MFKNYDPGKVVAIFRGIPLSGFAEGTFIAGEREVDAFSKVAGARGEITRVRSRNRSGMVTITLMAESPSNDSLSAVAILDEASGLGFGPLTVKDLNGNTILSAPVAWIQKVPNVEHATDASTREWVIAVASFDVYVGGALF
jgi:hypothetical protein